MLVRLVYTQLKAFTGSADDRVTSHATNKDLIGSAVYVGQIRWAARKDPGKVSADYLPSMGRMLAIMQLLVYFSDSFLHLVSLYLPMTPHPLLSH